MSDISMIQHHKELGIALSHNKIFVQWVNKTLSTSILKISRMVPTLDYRIVGSRSYFNIMDPATFKNLSKLMKSNADYLNSLKTLDWDVVIIPRNACGCMSSIADPEEKDYQELMKKICKELDETFDHRKDELNWILGDYGMKVDKIAFSVDTFGTHRFSLAIQCNGATHNVGILDVFNGSKDKMLVSNPKLYFQDCYGFKYIGLVDILSNLYKAAKVAKSVESFNALYYRLTYVLNCAALGLLSKSYYTKVQMFINKGKEPEKAYLNYLEDIRKVLIELVSVDIIRTKMEDKSNVLLSYEQTDTSLQLQLTPGSILMTKTLIELINNSHNEGLKKANEQKKQNITLVASILKSCCSNKCENINQNGGMQGSETDTDAISFDKRLSMLTFETITKD